MKPSVVTTSTYTSKYVALQDNLFVLERVHDWRGGAEEIDALPHAWLFLFLKLRPGQVSVRRKGKLIPVVGEQGIFVPPHGLIHWVLGPDIVVWHAYISNAELPSDMPTKPILFPYSPSACPINVDDIFSLIRSTKDYQSIDKVEKSSSVAERLKKIIDQTFDSNITIGEISSELRISHEVMDRMFKACYGTTPVKYRNKLRVFAAQHKIIFKPRAIGQIAYEVGFADISRFNKNFKKIINSTPSNFQIATRGK